jgi:hypothetical protein
MNPGATRFYDLRGIVAGGPGTVTIPTLRRDAQILRERIARRRAAALEVLGSLALLACLVGAVYLAIASPW